MKSEFQAIGAFAKRQYLRYFTEGDYTNLAGGNVNLFLGRRFGAVVDFGYYRNFRYDWNGLQAGIAFRYGLEDLF